jgi:hypothetical protein
MKPWQLEIYERITLNQHFLQAHYISWEALKSYRRLEQMRLRVLDWIIAAFEERRRFRDELLELRTWRQPDLQDWDIPPRDRRAD